MKYLLIIASLAIVFTSCRPCKELQVTKIDTIIKHVLKIDTVSIDNDNVLRELDKVYYYSDSLYNELLICKVNSNVHDAPLIYVAPKGKLKIGKAKDLQITLIYKSQIDSLRIENIKKDKDIVKYKNDLSDCNQNKGIDKILSQGENIQSNAKTYLFIFLLIVIFCAGVYCGVKIKKLSEFLL